MTPTNEKQMVELRSSMTQVNDYSDNFQSIPRKPGAKKQQLYIGNLDLSLSVDELNAKLIRLFQERAQYHIETCDICVNTTNSNRNALVACSGNLDGIIRKLHRTELEGRRLVVQRERKRNPYDPAHASSSSSPRKPGSSFGGSSWSKPKKNRMVQSYTSSSSDNKGSVPHPREEANCEAITAELHKSKDPVGTAIAAAAAIGVISSMPPPPPGTGIEQAFRSKQPTDNEEGDFMSQCQQQPLSALLSEYGEQDPDWKLVQPDDIDDDAPDTCTKSHHQDQPTALDTATTTTTGTGAGVNQLQKQGKAPIHVEFVSFGYHHGAPVELRKNCSSHANPMPPFDCRDWLEPVPQYLAWQDGLSGAVKRALLYAKSNNNNNNNYQQQSEDDESHLPIRQVANDVAGQVAAVLVQAMEQGGHGYALPLKMLVFVGSESGRHRSVVLCELAATALRKQLRSNETNQFRQPCSVGTRHRDIERQQHAVKKQQHASASKSNKQRDLEVD